MREGKDAQGNPIRSTGVVRIMQIDIDEFEDVFQDYTRRMILFKTGAVKGIHQRIICLFLWNRKRETYRNQSWYK